MTRLQQIAQADRYIAQARRNIAEQARRIRTGTVQSSTTAQALKQLLSAMLKNVERHRAELLEKDRHRKEQNARTRGH